MKYKTELEARLDFVATAARYSGIKEGGAEHEELTTAYNAATEGYNMSMDDPWCAMFLSAIAAKLGYKRFPLECSCSRMLAKAEKLGLRIEGRGYRPQVGDWLIWDLDLNGSVDHIGVISGVEGDELDVLEGNYGDTVKGRYSIRYDDPRIYRYICPDYTERVERELAGVGDEKPTAPDKPGGTVTAYVDLDSVPEYARPTIEMLVREEALRGIEEGNLGLSEEMVRVLVIVDRLLEKAGVIKTK